MIILFSHVWRRDKLEERNVAAIYEFLDEAVVPVSGSAYSSVSNEGNGNCCNAGPTRLTGGNCIIGFNFGLP